MSVYMIAHVCVHKRSYVYVYMCSMRLVIKVATSKTTKTCSHFFWSKFSGEQEGLSRASEHAWVYNFKEEFSIMLLYFIIACSSHLSLFVSTLVLHLATSVCYSVDPSVCLPGCLSACLSVSPCPPHIWMSIFLVVHLLVHLSMSLCSAL